MKLQLPINICVEKYSECWTHMRLSFILENNNLYFWYCENFNNYYVNSTDFSVEFENSFSDSYFTVYNEILFKKQLTISPDITRDIVNTLNQKGYVIVFGNYKYISESTLESNHEFLIFGYDEYTKNFDIYLFYENKWLIKQIAYDKLYLCIKTGIESEKEYFFRKIKYELPCVAYFFKNNIQRRTNLESIYMQFSRLLEGAIYIKANYKNSLNRECGRLFYHNNKVYLGTATYNAYIENLKPKLLSEERNEIRESLFRGFYHIIGVKKQLHSKIKYVFTEWGIVIDEKFHQQYTEIIQEWTKVKYLIMKYYYDNKMSHIDVALEKLNQLKMKEEQWLQFLIGYIYRKLDETKCLWNEGIVD